MSASNIHVAKDPPFNESLFYESGTTIATFEGPNGTYEVLCEGDVRATYQGEDLRTADDFRTAFPDGVIPDEVEFENNNWFAIRLEGDTGLAEEVQHDYDTAVTAARDAAGLGKAEAATDPDT